MLTATEIIATCYKLTKLPNIEAGEPQDVYESLDGNTRYYINRKAGVPYLWAVQQKGYPKIICKG